MPGDGSANMVQIEDFSPGHSFSPVPDIDFYGVGYSAVCAEAVLNTGGLFR